MFRGDRRHVALQTYMSSSSLLPLSADQIARLEQLVSELAPSQVAWLGGYLTGIGAGGAVGSAQQAAIAPAVAVPSVTILYMTQTGNAEGVANDLAAALKAHSIPVVLSDVAEFSAKKLKSVGYLALIASTYGEGEPPDTGEDFYNAVMGDRAAKMADAKFAVFGLGDSTYEFFCKLGADFDSRFEALGGTRLLDRVDCDVDYDDQAAEWVTTLSEKIAAEVAAAAPAPVSALSAIPASTQYDKKNPFPAELSERILLNGRGSHKEVYHIELSLEDSGLSHTPGDSIGVVSQNSNVVVEALQGAMGWSGTEDADGSPVSDALKLTYDITSLSPQVLEKYNAFAQSDTLTDLLQAEKRSELMDYIYGREVIDIVTEFPVSGLAPADLVGCLRKLAPRFFSVASSLKAYEEEVHLTVGAVRYCSHSRERLGVCSTFLADRVDIGDRLPTYVHANKNFRLPADPSAKMIMVGPGTGIAPFRAFLQDREADGAAGDNWLFFGDQHATTDFLYQLEWQRFLKSGLLSQMDVAFSRDQDHKIYVQHRMQEHAAQLYAWLQEGAYFYVCGDEGNMAHDVHNTLVDIVAKHGGMAVDAAEEHVKSLQRDKRYQRDVY